MTDFDDLPIDHDNMDQSLLDVDERTRTNPLPWNGQFSPGFVEAILSRYATGCHLVIDPFVGSGTTLVECARLGIPSHGVELNPSAYHMAKVYELSNISMDERTEVIKRVDETVREVTSSFLYDSCDHFLESIRHANGRTRDVLTTLFILSDAGDDGKEPRKIRKSWGKLKGVINGLPDHMTNVTAELGDARRIGLPDSTSDFLLTSPPYVNVFNYHQRHRKSVEALGYDVLGVARGEFGSNRKNRQNRFLTVIQWCIDMSLSMLEATRVLSGGSRMVYVVGRESNVQGTKIRDGYLLYRLATETVGLEPVLRQERRFKNRFGRMIVEDILHFRSTNCESERKAVIDDAGKVAIDLLTGILRDVTDDTVASLVMRAINEADGVSPSPMPVVTKASAPVTMTDV